jgi:hypothetical protein
VGALTLVTAASSNHFRCLKNLLLTISVFEPDTRTIVYDLGLTPREAASLRKERWEVRRFPFKDHPSHLNVRIERGQYAWKPVIVADTLREVGGMVLWLDAGNLLHAPLTCIRQVLHRHGVYTPISGGDIRQWTHPGTLRYLRAANDLLAKPNRNAACVGLNVAKPGILHLAERLESCALDPRCIAPPGSNRLNHRQDQAVLSVLVYQFQKRYRYVLVDEWLGVSAQNDHRSGAEVRRWLKRRSV